MDELGFLEILCGQSDAMGRICHLDDEENVYACFLQFIKRMQIITEKALTVYVCHISTYYNYIVSMDVDFFKGA